jgi:hypothetical protein
MADSVREKIMKNVQAALQGITVANGYNTTLNAVERIMQQSQSTIPPMLIIGEGQEKVLPDGPLSGSTGLTAKYLTLYVRAVVQQDTDSDARSASEALNALAADIQRKMQEDYTRGGFAINTQEVGLSPVQMEPGDAPALFLDSEWQVHYRHNRLDPTLAG